MKVALLIFHLLIAGSLVGVILMQSGKGGLGSAFGGGGVYRSKRGAEKIIFRGTFVLAVLFLLTSVANMLVQ
jgi:preprotein translocase subunit SecG